MTDGTLDTSFVNPQLNNWVQTLALQPDGKVLVAGRFTTVAGTAMQSVARLNNSVTPPDPDPICFWTDLINASQVCSTPPE